MTNIQIFEDLIEICMDFTISEVKSAKYYGNPINPQGFQSKILQILRII